MMFLSPRANASLSEWLQYVEYLHNAPIELGLERVKQVAQRLGLLQPNALVITVAGTNGKGTTCHTLESIFLAAGYQVGLYTSPHLLRYTERVRIQGKECSEQELITAFAAIEVAREEISLTYFEFGTLAALLLFNKSKRDVLILEVGLGGRLDATNIVDADLAIITTIDIDHTEWLGNSRESVGQEKAGIIRYQKPVVIGDKDLPYSVFKKAEMEQAPLFRFGKEWSFVQTETSWCWRNIQGVNWNNLPIPQVPLANAATALTALYALGLLGKEITRYAVEEGLRKVFLPGRLQCVNGTSEITLDVAHNPQAAKYLANFLSQQIEKKQKIHAVIAMLADKDIKEVLAPLLPLVNVWYCASLSVSRGAKAEQIMQYLPTAQSFRTVKDAWYKALEEAAPNDRVLVFGSFHTVAEVMELLPSVRKNGH